MLTQSMSTITDSGDTVEVLKEEITETAEVTERVKNVVVNNLENSIKKDLAAGNYDSYYYEKAAAEMEFRLKNGTPNGHYTEEEVPIEETPIKKQKYRKKSKWTIFKENLKKVLF